MFVFYLVLRGNYSDLSGSTTLAVEVFCCLFGAFEGEFHHGQAVRAQIRRGWWARRVQGHFPLSGISGTVCFRMVFPSTGALVELAH